MLTLMLTLISILLGVRGNPTSPPLEVDKRDDIDITCFGKCFGIDRSRALDAIDWFCRTFDGFNLNYNIDEGTLAVAGNYSYEPTSWHWTPNPSMYYEEGIIAMSMGYFFNAPDEDNSCQPLFESFDIYYDLCSWGLREAIDNCDTGGENGKQGGRFRSECFQWNFNPNPIEPCTRS